jgi:hypothetical protein
MKKKLQVLIVMCLIILGISTTVFSCAPSSLIDQLEMDDPGIFNESRFDDSLFDA